MNDSDVPLRRSLLATPANDAGKIASAVDSDADEVLMDLEDSLAPSEKVSARSVVIDAVDAHDWSKKTLSYRINDVGTRWWYEDVIEIVEAIGSHVDNIVVPKVNRPAEVTAVETLLEQVEVNAGLETGSIGVAAQIETAAGMNNVTDVAHVSDRLSALMFGPGDYITSIGAGGQNIGGRSSYPGHYWHYPLSRIAHAAASANLLAIDGPYADFEDIDGFRQSCEYARMLGYDGKISVHPQQTGIVNDVFAPSLEEAERALHIVEVYSEADSSVASIEGKVIDDATYRMAKRIVSMAEKANVLS